MTQILHIQVLNGVMVNWIYTIHSNNYGEKFRITINYLPFDRNKYYKESDNGSQRTTRRKRRKYGTDLLFSFARYTAPDRFDKFFHAIQRFGIGVPDYKPLMTNFVKFFPIDGQVVGRDAIAAIRAMLYFAPNHFNSFVGYGYIIYMVGTNCKVYMPGTIIQVVIVSSSSCPYVTQDSAFITDYKLSLFLFRLLNT